MGLQGQTLAPTSAGVDVHVQSYGFNVADIAALRALGLTDRPAGQWRTVDAKDAFYEFEEANTDADDGDLTIKPNDLGGGDPGRWIKRAGSGLAPTAHAVSHTDGSDDIQSATAAQKGVATAAQITKLDAIEALADVTGSNAPQAHALAGAEHSADILANLNIKISDAVLVAASFISSPAGIWIPAGVQGPWHTSLGSPDNSVSGGWAQTRFHDGSDEEISTTFRLPDIDLAVNPTMTLYFAPDELQGSALVVRLTNGSEYAGVGEVFPVASEGADSSVSTPIPQRELFSEVDTLTASLMTDGDLVEYHVGRASTHVDDTLVGHLSFFGALFLYSKKVI